MAQNTDNSEQLLVASVLLNSDPEDAYLQTINAIKPSEWTDEKAINGLKLIEHNFNLSLGIDAPALIQSNPKNLDLINEISDLPVNPKHVSEYIKSVKKQAFKRNLDQSLISSRKLLESGTDVKDILHNLTEAMADYNSTNSETKSIKEALGDTMKEVADRFNHPEQQIGISTGFKTIDKMILGLQKGELSIIAARPSVGKTAFALNLVKAASNSTKLPIMLFSLEMSDDSLNLRLLASVSGIDLWKIKTGRMTKDELHKVVLAQDYLSQRNIYLDDRSLQSIDDITAKVMSFQRKHGQIGLVLVDYLGLIDTNEGRNSNRVNEVSKISRGLKVLAGDINTPVVALSQLSRAVEQRNDKRPMLSDLRDSGSIEQDADFVAFLYRNDYYQKNPEAKDPDQVVVEFIIAKNRNGERGTVYLVFDKSKQRFLEGRNND